MNTMEPKDFLPIFLMPLGAIIGCNIAWMIIFWNNKYKEFITERGMIIFNLIGILCLLIVLLLVYLQYNL